PAPAVRAYLLFGQGQADAPAAALPLDPQFSDLTQDGPHRIGRVPVDFVLQLRVVEAGTALHQRPAHVHVGALAVAIDVDRPEDGGACLAGQQRGGVFGQHFRVERDFRVAAIERLAAAVRFTIDGITRRDERADVGNRVVDAVPRGSALEE